MAKANKSFGYTDAFPSRFRDLADEKGCTMEEMAQAFSTTRQTVKLAEWGNNSRCKKYLLYRKFFQCND